VLDALPDTHSTGAVYCRLLEFLATTYFLSNEARSEIVRLIYSKSRYHFDIGLENIRLFHYSLDNCKDLDPVPFLEMSCSALRLVSARLSTADLNDIRADVVATFTIIEKYFDRLAKDSLAEQLTADGQWWLFDDLLKIMANVSYVDPLIPIGDTINVLGSFASLCPTDRWPHRELQSYTKKLRKLAEQLHTVKIQKRKVLEADSCGDETISKKRKLGRAEEGSRMNFAASNILVQ